MTNNSTIEFKLIIIQGLASNGNNEVIKGMSETEKTMVVSNVLG